MYFVAAFPALLFRKIVFNLFSREIDLLLYKRYDTLVFRLAGRSRSRA